MLGVVEGLEDGLLVGRREGLVGERVGAVDVEMASSTHWPQDEAGEYTCV